MERVVVEREFAVPVERAYAFLAHHENLGPLFGATVKRLRDGDESPNGSGSVRSLSIGPIPLAQETITEADLNRTIVYRITKGSPLRNHKGTMRFEERPGGRSFLRYEIEFGALVPGLAKVVAFGLTRSIRRGLAKVDSLA